MQLDLDLLHSPLPGRQGGKTTAMLARAIGCLDFVDRVWVVCQTEFQCEQVAKQAERVARALGFVAHRDRFYGLTLFATKALIRGRYCGVTIGSEKRLCCVMTLWSDLGRESPVFEDHTVIEYENLRCPPLTAAVWRREYECRPTTASGGRFRWPVDPGPRRGG